MTKDEANKRMREEMAKLGNGQHGGRVFSEHMADILERYINDRLASLSKIQEPHGLAQQGKEYGR